MSLNYKVSSDVDTMLKSADNESILSNIGAVSETNVSQNADSISSLQDGQQQNSEAIALKADKASPDFTGTATFSGGTVNLDNSTSNKIVLENGNFDQATLELSSGSLKLKANNTSGSGGLGTFLKADVNGTPSDEVSLDASSGTLHLIGNQEVKIESEGDIKLDADDNGEVSITGNCSVAGDLNVAGDHTINTGRLNVREIQCQGGTTNTAIPINYDAKEHRFRDFDANPTNLMVIEKIDNKNGARIGINVEDNDTPRCALEIVHGSSENSSGTATTNRETLRVMGGSFFNEWARVGHYTSDPSDAPVGSIIYRSDNKTFKGNCGSDGWKTFTMS